MGAVSGVAPPPPAARSTLPWFAGGSPAPTRARESLADTLFLTAAVLLSAAPYVTGLGLYSDDWTLLSTMYEAGGSWSRLFAAVLPIEMDTRPVQAAVLATLYAVFGTDPLGYHIVNACVLAGAVVLFHRTLMMIGFARVPAVLIPLIFGLLPHYGTDRVWIAAFQANVSVLLYFASLFADLRFIRGRGPAMWIWKTIGSLTLAASVLAYEVTAPLLLLNVLILGWVALHDRPRTEVRPVLAGIASNVIVLAATIGYKLSTTVRADVSGGYAYRVIRIVREAVPVHFGEYGMGLPARVVQTLGDGAPAAVVAAALLIGIGSAVWVQRIDAAGAEVRAIRWPAVLALGVILFFAGYGVTLMTWEIGFHATGANNRTAIAGAIGVGFVFVGAAGSLAGLLPAREGRAIFTVVVGLLAASCTLITGFVAHHWVGAVREQDTVITAIREHFPEPPEGGTLLLDGFCPYVGPAPVFATGWDVTGMLQLIYDVRNVRGDVIKPNSEATPAGLRTILFDDVISVYPYGPDLMVLHAGLGRVFRLTDVEVARDYLATVSAESRPACAPYTDGDGADVF